MTVLSFPRPAPRPVSMAALPAAVSDVLTDPAAFAHQPALLADAWLYAKAAQGLPVDRDRTARICPTARPAPQLRPTEVQAIRTQNRLAQIMGDIARAWDDAKGVL